MNKKIERNDKRMKRKNGFTLIELLAVIVILAIIALIAVPVVMNIINRANKSAFKDSAYGILKAGETFYTSELLQNAVGVTDDTTFTFPNDIEGLEIKGSKPTGGSMTVRKDGKISMAIHNGKHCVKKGFEDDDVTITDDIENCKLSVIPKTLTDLATTGTFEFSYGISPIEVKEVDVCATSGICEPGTAFAIRVNNTETYKFYVIADTGSEVTLIMDRNLYSLTDENNGNVAWISEEDYVGAGGKNWIWIDEYGDEYEGNTDKGLLTALRILKERTSGWTNIPAHTYTLENDYDGSDGENTYPNITGELVTNVRSRLPQYSELDSIILTYYNKYDFLFENCLNQGDNNTVGYWTSTAGKGYSDSAYIFYSDGNVAENGLAYEEVFELDSIGLRPVITLSK